MNLLKKIFIFILCALFGLLLHGWSALALYYCIFSAQSGLRPIPAGLYLLIVISFIILQRKHTQAFFISLLGFVLVALWFNTIEPKIGGIYPKELTLPFADIKGDSVVVHHVRNCIYRTKDDFDVHYETRTYDLSKLKTLDVMVNYWGMEAIAHTFLAFGFSDGKYIDVSVEIRPEVGKAYDMLQGFFKQYQLIYIWADERDLIRLRTNYKKENVYLYRTTFSPKDVQKLFLSMLETTNVFIEKPQFYNTLTHSCTNTLGNHLKSTKIIELPFWKRKFLTGDIDQRLYKEGRLVTYGLSFAELRKRANIDQRAHQANDDSQFSQRIRTHLKEL